MDAFERVVASLLERDGYWVRSSYKVALTAEDKRAIGRLSSPRWELDLIAYKGSTKELRVVECKSYLDSRGVTLRAVAGTDPSAGKRYKLFCDQTVRSVVLGRLAAQLLASGACPSSLRITLCLAAGKIPSGSERRRLRTYFAEQGWVLWDEEWLGEQLLQLSAGSYENDVASVVAKLILRARGLRASKSTTAGE